MPFESDVILRALSAIDPRSSTAEGILDPFLLMLSIPVIAEQLTHIFNLSISSGIFTQAWEMAPVTPLHKGCDKNHLYKYRPISKLSCMSKTLQSLVNN